MLPALFVAACASTGAEAKAPEGEPAAAEEPAGPAQSAPAGPAAVPDEPAAAATPAATRDTRPPPVPDDYEMTYGDCQALGARYEGLLRTQEFDKLNRKKLPPKVFAKAQDQVEGVVQKGTEQWMNQCRGIVGTVQIKSRLKCAVDAGSLERFNGCMDGKYDEREKEEKK